MNGKLEIEVGRGVRIKNLPLKIITKVKTDLTFLNPIYAEAIKMGRSISGDVSQYIILYDISKNLCWVPRGYIYFLIRYLKQVGIGFSIIDKTTSFAPPKSFELKFKGVLENYQKEAAEALAKYPNGVLEAGTGSGKTVLGCYMIAYRQQPTLIIVHSALLVKQWEKEIKRFLGFKCGIIGDNKFELKPITVAIIDSVNIHLEKLKCRFGQVIVDETHKIVANTWAYTLQDFSAKYLLGLTATAYRSDGLGDAIFACIGPKLHVINKQMLYKIKAILRPIVYRIETNYYFLFQGKWSDLIQDLVTNKQRNELICKIIDLDLKKHKEQILIVSDRKEHCSTITKILWEKYQLKAEILIGGGSKTKKEKILKNLQTGVCKILCATTKYVGEGFDIPGLSALFITTPIKFEGKLIQACGRVLRPKDRKLIGTTGYINPPRIYDFKDGAIRPLASQGRKRDAIYRQEDWVIK